MVSRGCIPLAVGRLWNIAAGRRLVVRISSVSWNTGIVRLLVRSLLRVRRTGISALRLDISLLLVGILSKGTLSRISRRSVLSACSRLASGHLGSLVIPGRGITGRLIIILRLGIALILRVSLCLGITLLLGISLRSLISLCDRISLIIHSSLIAFRGISVRLRIALGLGSVLFVSSHISFLSAVCGNRNNQGMRSRKCVQQLNI